MALRVKETDEDGVFEVSGRGELHLTILLENMRREGYELAVSKPRVVYRDIDGVRSEPMELLTVDIEEGHQGGVMQALGERKVELVNMEPDGKGRVPAAEVLANTAAIKEYIRDKDKLSMVEHAIAEGHMQYRSQTFDQALLELYRTEQITLETAMNAATNKDDFDLKVRGISGTSDRGWM